jgi:hypothetical protein
MPAAAFRGGHSFWQALAFSFTALKNLKEAERKCPYDRF